MRITLVILVLGILQVHAGEAYSQKTKLSLNFVETELINVLDEIEKESEFFFLYNEKLLDTDRKVSIAANDQLMSVVLDNLFAGTDVKYTIIDRKIILAPEFIMEEKQQQQQRITGTVIDANTGETLPGVNVHISGTQIGTTTDQNGKFSMQAPAPNASIEFSYIGYLTETVPYTGQTVININLVTDIKELEEVVVIGYGTVKKSDVTGSVASITEENLNGGMVIAPHQAMQGRVSGVNITLNSGEPGANSSVRIRGGTSINASNSPLYVIDGVPVAFDESSYTSVSTRQTRTANNPLNMINAADIKSIDILKDASATAIYGARGANGVIIITTKQGVAGKSKVSYDTYVGVAKIRKKLDLLSGEEFRSYINSHPEIQNWVDGGSNTDWQDEIFRTAINHSHNLAIAAGDSKTNYRASVNYSDQQGIIIKSALKRTIARVNVNHKALNDRLDLKFFVSGAMLNNKSAPVPESAGSDRDGGIIRDALLQDPTYPVKDENGKYTFRGILNQNPVEQANTLIDDNETFRSLGNLTADFKLTDFLTFSTNVGFTKEFTERGYYAPKSSRIGSNSQGMASKLMRNGFSKLLETNLLFSKTLGSKHDVNAMVGYSFQEFMYNGSFNYATKFISDVTTYNNLGAGLNQYPASSYKNSNKLISFFGRATYGFDNRYLLTVTVRRDGSSRFGINNKWGVFPSMALAWKITEEDFMKDNKIFSNLKLRAGYGVTGNQEIGNYRSLPTLSGGGNLYIIGGKAYTAVGANQYYNPDLRWESSAQGNIGVDFGLWNNRINGSIDLYNKKTKDLLLTFNVPSPAEVTTTTANVGGIKNSGIEAELNAFILSEGTLKWEAYANISHNRQEVTSLSNDTWKTSEIYTGVPRAPGFTGITTQIIKPGEPLGAFYGYEYIGVDESGIQQFRDLNNDGKILPGTDRKIIGTNQPDLLYGFGSKFGYKDFSLDFFFRGSYGNQILNSTALDLQNITRLPAFNIMKDALSDDIAYGQTAVYSSKWIQDASFLRLENATLGYNVRLKSAKVFSKLYLYVSGQNLFVMTKYTGFDPEVTDGVDYITYPKPRSFVMGLSVEF